MNATKRFFSLLIILLLSSSIIVSCSPGIDQIKEASTVISPKHTHTPIAAETTNHNQKESEEPADIPTPEPADPADIPDYFPSFPFDGILPVYDPKFARVEDVSGLVFDDELVMGVAWEGEAKAYPVTVMRFREMVNDELAGIPTLVTW